MHIFVMSNKQVMSNIAISNLPSVTELQAGFYDSCEIINKGNGLFEFTHNDIKVSLQGVQCQFPEVGYPLHSFLSCTDFEVVEEDIDCDEYRLMEIAEEHFMETEKL